MIKIYFCLFCFKIYFFINMSDIVRAEIIKKRESATKSLKEYQNSV